MGVAKARLHVPGLILGAEWKAHRRRKIRLIESNAKCRYLKN
jgi:hypothetical protein